MPKPTTASAARRARAAISDAAPPSQRQLELARLRLLHTRTCGCQLGVRGGSWHVALQPRGEEDKPPADAALFFRTQSDHSQRGEARARRNLECCASFPETAKNSARPFASHAAAGLALEVAADTPHHGRALKERSLPPVQRSSMASMGPKPTTTSAAWRARPASLSAAPTPQRQLKPAHVRLLLTRKPAWHWGRRLTRHTTAARRKREAPAGAAPFVST